ncbi:hypothetical protein [Pleomorphomonas carboxyditropha]|uniref:hypothetical protein n=1 Tax=Pleomorphomonas carboxyditropha TaxID=2023338 RepID=UPI001056B7A7|nr:hypothetical protein [Pleomorphomonas carboxyditropha]
MSNPPKQSLTPVVAIAPVAIVAARRTIRPDRGVVVGSAATNGNNADNDYDDGKQDVLKELHVHHPVIGSGKKS